MLKLNKKGFTIVELVIVIAVVAILAAVLIPTFVNLMQTANESADIQLVTNLNKLMAMQEALDGKKNATMQDALDDAFANGYDISKISPTSKGNDIVWDQTADRFALVNPTENKLIFQDEATPIKDLDSDEIYTLWKIYDEETGIPETQTYSIYWADTNAPDFKGKALTVGFDAGECSSISALNYSRNSEALAQKVIIRTGSFNTSLTVNAPNDTVSHYGNASKVVITAVANESYDEFGRTTVIEVKHGHVVLTEDAVVEKVVITSAEDNTVSIELSISVQIEKVNTDTSIENLRIVTKGTATAFVADESLKNKVNGKSDKATEISTFEQLETVLTNGGFAKLIGSVTGTSGKSLVVSEGKTVYIDLNGHDITNPVVAKAAIINKGTLTFAGKGIVLNGNQNFPDSAKNANGSHVIENAATGYLHIIDGTYGSDSNVGNAIRNFGNCVIDGGSFSAVKNGTGKGYAYVFANGSKTERGVMVINNASALNIEANGMFAADAGEIIINGGNYTLVGKQSYYMFYGVVGSGRLVINNGTFTRTGSDKFFGYSVGEDTQTSYTTIVENAKDYGITINGGKIEINGETVLGGN